MSKPMGFYDLRQALSEPGCALCRLLAKNADGYVDAVLWELVNDDETRHNLNRARGYCREHGWLLVRNGASLGIAILMRDVIKTVSGVLDAGGFETQPGFSLRRAWPTNQAQPNPATAGLVAALSSQAPCPVCASLQVAEAHYVEAFLSHLTGPDTLAASYRASDGFCLPHFRLALSSVADEATFVTLAEAQQAIWQRLQAELSEFIRKNDYNYKDESFGPEGDSWRRAIEAVSGAAPAKVRNR